MAPDKPDRPRRAARDEFEVAYYTKELGRPLQRKMLQSRLNELMENTISAASHGDDPKVEVDSPPPREDRAG